MCKIFFFHEVQLFWQFVSEISLQIKYIPATKWKEKKKIGNIFWNSVQSTSTLIRCFLNILSSFKDIVCRVIFRKSGSCKFIYY